MQSDRHLGHSGAEETRLDDHLGRELHPRAPLRESLVVDACEAAHPAVHVADRRIEPTAGQPREHWIPPPAMQKWHRAGKEGSAARRKSASLREIVTLAQLLEKAWDLTEIVAVVRVAHEDVLPASRGDSSHESGAVAFLANRDDARAE